MLQLISSPRIARHSAGWKVGRLLTDRGGKNIVESPNQWGRHRALTVDDAARSIAQRIIGIAQAQRLIRHP